MASAHTAESDVIDSAPGRRERKKQATRQALHQAAWALVEERGLSNVTVEAITDRVDVATRTFFNYYSSKEEAVLGGDSERVESLCASVTEHLDAGAAPLDALQLALRDDAYWSGITSDQLRRRMQLVRNEPMLFSVAATQWEEMGRRLAALIASATGADAARDLYPQLVVNTAIGAARIAVMHWADHPDQDLATLVDDAIAAVRAGLPAPAASGPPSKPPPEGARR